MLGIPVGQLGGKREHIPDPPCIWPDMLDGYGLFVAMGTQWRMVGGMAGTQATGLDYGVLAPTAAASGIAMTPTVFSDVRALEAEALRAWSERRR